MIQRGLQGSGTIQLSDTQITLPANHSCQPADLPLISFLNIHPNKGCLNPGYGPALPSASLQQAVEYEQECQTGLSKKDIVFISSFFLFV